MTGFYRVSGAPGCQGQGGALEADPQPEEQHTQDPESRTSSLSQKEALIGDYL